MFEWLFKIFDKNVLLGFIVTALIILPLVVFPASYIMNQTVPIHTEMTNEVTILQRLGYTVQVSPTTTIPDGIKLTTASYNDGHTFTEYLQEIKNSNATVIYYIIGEKGNFSWDRTLPALYFYDEVSIIHAYK